MAGKSAEALKPQPPPKLPGVLSQLELKAGAHNRYLKVLFFGQEKVGKSFAAASFPAPMLAIDCGDGGIGNLLPTPKEDPRYKVINATDPDQLALAVKYAVDNQDYFESVVIDPLTEAWVDTMDHWNEKFGVDQLKASHWRKVKSPWKRMLRDLRRATFHVAYTAWLRDLQYIETGAPGESGNLAIRPQCTPNVEKSVGYAVDLIMNCDVERDALQKPTNVHTITFFGGRRPRSVDPKLLHLGQTWKFNARKPSSPWETIFVPLTEQWEDGAAEVFGLDPAEAEASIKEMEQVAEDADVGRLIRMIEEYDGKTVDEYKAWFAEEVFPAARGMSKAAVERVRLTHEKKKEALASRGGK